MKFAIICLFSVMLVLSGASNGYAFARIQIHGQRTEIPICPPVDAPSGYTSDFSMRSAEFRVSDLSLLLMNKRFLKYQHEVCQAQGKDYWCWFKKSPREIYTSYQSEFDQLEYEYLDNANLVKKTFNESDYSKLVQKILEPKFGSDNWMGPDGGTIEFGYGVSLTHLAPLAQMCSLPPEDSVYASGGVAALKKQYFFKIPFGASESTLVTIPGFITQDVNPKVEVNFGVNIVWSPNYWIKNSPVFGRPLDANVLKLLLEVRQKDGSWKVVAAKTAEGTFGVGGLENRGSYTLHIEANLSERSVIRARLVADLSNYGEAGHMGYVFYPSLTQASVFGSTCFPDLTDPSGKCLP